MAEVKSLLTRWVSSRNNRRVSHAGSKPASKSASDDVAWIEAVMASPSGIRALMQQYEKQTTGHAEVRLRTTSLPSLSVASIIRSLHDKPNQLGVVPPSDLGYLVENFRLTHSYQCMRRARREFPVLCAGPFSTLLW